MFADLQVNIGKFPYLLTQYFPRHNPHSSCIGRARRRRVKSYVYV